MLKKLLIAAAVSTAVLAGTAAPASAGTAPKGHKCTTVAVISILNCSKVTIDDVIDLDDTVDLDILT